MKLLQKLYTETLSYNSAAFIYVLSQISVCFKQQIRICLTEIFKHLTFKMSVKILAESEAYWERTLVHQTVYENFVVLIQQRKRRCVAHLPSLPSSKASFKCNCRPTRENRPIRKHDYYFWWPTTCKRAASISRL